MGLVVPAVFSAALSTENGNAFARETLNISRATAVILLFAYLVYVLPIPTSLSLSLPSPINTSLPHPR